ncbi:hypothetical protein LPJ53_002687 [Coemansia erecta]|uniref:SGNH hydrolase n=1 Tax=Coemansia erecta TaxID=147472 RepID=A0A9W8CRL6_9FUNG|nr:hypothetical protein LPJ53_002687 [Coemansia erecta]
MKLVTLALTLVITLTTTTTAAAAAAIKQPSLYVFGDSISDTGRLRALTLNMIPPAPYWQGRFSSGPVWAEYTALLQTKQLRNYAVGAAVTNTSDLELFGFLPLSIPSTHDQIKSASASAASAAPGASDVAVLEIGGNDIMTVLPDVVEGKTSAAAFADALSGTVVQQAQMLAAMGFRTILVANAPPMQLVPLMKMERRAATAGTISAAYNAQLSAKLSTWQQQQQQQQKQQQQAPGVRIGLLDLNTFVQNALSPSVSGALGLRDTENACVGGNLLGLFSDANHVEALVRFLVDVKGAVLCSKPGAQFFWDPIHPGERVHRLFGYYASKVIGAMAANQPVDAPTQGVLLGLVAQYNLASAVAKPAAV